VYNPTYRVIRRDDAIHPVVSVAERATVRAARFGEVEEEEHCFGGASAASSGAADYLVVSSLLFHLLAH
jgi:hypothetical protein